MKQSNVENQLKEHNPENCQTPGCERCKLKKPFDLPSEIVDACKAGNLIVFAGAGVSTESASVYKHTFYQKIRDELKIPE